MSPKAQRLVPLVQRLLSQQSWFQASDLVAIAGKHRNTLLPYLQELCQLGWLQKHGAGAGAHYKATPGGPLDVKHGTAPLARAKTPHAFSAAPALAPAAAPAPVTEAPWYSRWMIGIGEMLVLMNLAFYGGVSGAMYIGSFAAAALVGALIVGSLPTRDKWKLAEFVLGLRRGGPGVADESTPTDLWRLFGAALGIGLAFPLWFLARPLPITLGVIVFVAGGCYWLAAQRAIAAAGQAKALRKVA